MFSLSFFPPYIGGFGLGVSKKTEKTEKTITEKTEPKQKRIKPIIFFVKIFVSVRFYFDFRNLKPAKPQPNRTGSV